MAVRFGRGILIVAAALLFARVAPAQEHPAAVRRLLWGPDDLGIALSLNASRYTANDATGDMMRAFMATPVGNTIARIAFNTTAQAKKALAVTRKKGRFVGLHPIEQKILEQQGGRIVANLIKMAGLG